MFKRLVNEILVELAIRPDGPILIKSGIETVAGPRMAFVRTYRSGQPEPYLPGSSIKGVLRGQAERIARTFGEDKACDPLAETSCGKRLKQDDNENQEKRLTPFEVYAASCPICRLFGSTQLAGRLAVADAYRTDEPRIEERDGVGIDRFTGGAFFRPGVGGAKFDMEVVVSGTFVTTLQLRNFELSQVGLLAFLLQDLKEGMIRIGSGKSRGLGRVTAEIRSVRVDYVVQDITPPSNGRLLLRGTGDLLGEELARQYGLARPDAVEIEFNGEWMKRPASIRSSALFPGDTFPWGDVAHAWVNFIQAYRGPVETGSLALKSERTESLSGRNTK